MFEFIEKKVWAAMTLILKIMVSLALAFVMQKLIVNDFIKLKKSIADNSFASLFTVDEEKVAMKARINTLNRQRPDFTYLIQVVEDPDSFDPDRFQKYVQYYERITEYFPGLPEAWGMLGFCYHFYPDKKSLALKAYERAIQLNPHFFWFHYNKAALHYQQAQYDQAIEAAQAALTRDLKISARFILSSRYIYRQVLPAYYEKSGVTMEKQFAKGYAQCLVMLLLSYDQGKEYQKAVPLALKLLSMEQIPRKKVYFHLGKATFHLKQYQRSLAFLQEVLKENPVNADALHYVARNLQALGQTQAARELSNRRAVLLKLKKDKIPQWDPVRLEVF